MTPTKPKRKNPADTTGRNNRARKKEIEDLKKRMDILESRLEVNEVDYVMLSKHVRAVALRQK